MMDKDLRSQVEGLFSDAGPEPELEESELLLEEAIAGLLTGEAEPDAAAPPPQPSPPGAEEAAAGPLAAEAPSPFPARPEGPREEGEIPPASTLVHEAPSGERRTRTLSILLPCVTTLGGVLLVFLLVRLMRQESTPWSGFHTLYLAAYALAIAITLIQWLFNSSLSRTLREAEAKRDEATQSQAILRKRARELAGANAPLQKRVLQLETVAQISQAINSVLEPEELMQCAVDLIRERFDLLTASLFLIDESGEWAVLQAGTRGTDRQALTQSHRVAVDDTSTVGWCAANAQVCTAPLPGAISASRHSERSRESDSGQSLVQVNSLLPGPRSEIALPLQSRGQLIGVLKLQSTEREAFSPEDVAVLQIVAGQVAAAIDNAQSFTQIRAELEQMEAHPRPDTHEQGSYFSPRRAALGYERTRLDAPSPDSATVPDGSSGLDQAVEEAMTNRHIVVQSDTGDGTRQAALVAPINLRGEALGALGLHEAEGERRWTDEEIALVEDVVNQMALAIENARLLDETQRRAEREQTLSQMTARFTRSLDMDTLLQTAVRELGQLLQADEVAVYLGTPPERGAEETER